MSQSTYDEADIDVILGKILREKKTTQNPPSIGSNIRNLRMERRLTQTQLGKKCGMFDSQIGLYERDEMKPRPETLERIASALGVPAAELTAGIR